MESCAFFQESIATCTLVPTISLPPMVFLGSQRWHWPCWSPPQYESFLWFIVHQGFQNGFEAFKETLEVNLRRPLAYGIYSFCSKGEQHCKKEFSLKIVFLIFSQLWLAGNLAFWTPWSGHLLCLEAQLSSSVRPWVFAFLSVISCYQLCRDIMIFC